MDVLGLDAQPMFGDMRCRDQFLVWRPIYHLEVCGLKVNQSMVWRSVVSRSIYGFEVCGLEVNLWFGDLWFRGQSMVWRSVV